MIFRIPARHPRLRPDLCRLAGRADRRARIGSGWRDQPVRRLAGAPCDAVQHHRECQLVRALATGVHRRLHTERPTRHERGDGGSLSRTSQSGRRGNRRPQCRLFRHRLRRIPIVLAALGQEALAPATIGSIITMCVIFAATIVIVEVALQSRPSRLALPAKVSCALIRNPILVASLSATAFPWVSNCRHRRKRF